MITDDPPVDYLMQMQEPSNGANSAGDETRLWHVTVTVSGAANDPEVVYAAMERLKRAHAFLHSLRYASDRAEICYWEQAPEMLDAAAMAMRVWNEHRETAGLPRWEVVGLEVLEQETYQVRQVPRSRARSAIGTASPTPVPF